ncbi:MAG: SpoVR family protein [Bdellovibrionaceae bacterium]|nr:SpoVR family protein [Pseudobdellovibrionaceae bacterium]|tara:strand:+ start:100205 stop:101704 length:1500 start_codon:yes stop_codon:yes gene_type:complete
MDSLPLELQIERDRIEKIAADYGLDFFKTIFEMVDYDQMSQLAAYGGFPTRYPHWNFGMQYEQLSKGYEYGLSKIYEMVINTDPCYAYLMKGNELVDQKLVMAHVFGHCDFFKNNKWFEPTDRKMMDTMANHATRIRRYMDRYGYDVVENFIDRCLSIENLIDRYSPYVKRATKEERRQEKERVENIRNDRFYMQEYMEGGADVRGVDPAAQEERASQAPNFPIRPERDVLLFLINYAQLENWQQDILSIIRDESYYFSPQGMTKIMNEGWASYWHSKLMTEKIMHDCDIITFADKHAGTMAMSPNGFNPYKVGIELFRDIEERWNKGRFGREWEELDNFEEKNRWDKHVGLGRKKIFEVRRDYNDVTFIDEFLTEDFCVRNKMFVYNFNKRTGQFELDTRNFKAIKQQLLFQLTNHGQPIIDVVNGNHNNRGELLLKHLHEGVDMQPNYMEETLKNVAYIWGRPVNIHTKMEDKESIFRWDGKEFSEEKLEEDKPGDK